MDFRNISTVLQNGLSLLKQLEPLAVLGGPQIMAAAKIAATLGEIGQNALEKISDGTVVATSDDKEQIEALLADIQAENDTLAERVAAS